MLDESVPSHNRGYMGKALFAYHFEGWYVELFPFQSHYIAGVAANPVKIVVVNSLISQIAVVKRDILVICRLP